MKKWLVRIMRVNIALLLLSGAASAGQWANPDLLVSADQLKQNLSKTDWVVVDCRDLEDYAKGHIPGAISFGKECKKALRDGTARVFHDTSRYEKILGKVGIGNNSHVVFYGDMKKKTMDSATVGFWVLEYLGDTNAHVLNGGLEAWVKEGGKLDPQPTIKQPTTFKAHVAYKKIATTDEVLKIAKAQEKGVQLIDARTEKEHEGYDIRSVRGGHVPHTTINIDYLKTFDTVKDPATGKDTPTGYLSPDKVAKMFASLDKNKRTVVHCQTGTRSTVEYLEMRLLGFKEPANWDESWIVWGNDLTKRFPIEDEQWIDLSRIDKLEKAVKKLEKKLKTAEGGH
jgi:thiosulfate/3-mercaptopyruvate sulfurtransferase